jgi:cob(I)alamin adenosyltransferase
LVMLCDAVRSTASRRIRVYTRTGDAGTTSLFNGERKGKDEAFFDALGDVDELCAHIGLVREHCGIEAVGIEDQLVEIQSRLLDVGSAVATPQRSSTAAQLARARFASTELSQQLEQWIDAMDDELPPLKNFILPSGGMASSQLHIARTVCRRAERMLVPLIREGDLDPGVGRYINRLSDYLFIAARFAAAKAKRPEVVYKKARATAALSEADIGAQDDSLRTAGAIPDATPSTSNEGVRS